MRRRDFIKVIVGSAITWPLAARAQQQVQRSPPVVGMLLLGKPTAPITLSIAEACREGLREEGFVEDQNIRTQNRYGDDLESLRRGADDLVRLNVSVIVASGTPAILAAKRATTNIPIVGANMADPVADGLVASLARPGGKITGTTFLGPELQPKRLQLLREVVPGARRIAALQHPAVYGEATMRKMLESIEEAANASGLALQVVSANGREDFDSAFKAITAASADALIILPSPMFYVNYRRLVDLAERSRLPTMYVFKEAVEGGGLMSYGPDIPDLARLACKYVTKILNGAKPSDLPVEQPVKFELAINLKTAKVLSLTVPPGLLVAADEVIE
jgi:putative tryptophan/tyrosine transport system substrate-binding protein